MMKHLALTALLFGGLAACTDPQNRIAFDGQFFRTNVAKVDKSRDTFVLSVRNPGKSIQGARLAAHHEGIRYCVGNFGTSKIEWDVNPLDEAVPPQLEDGKLVYRGKCPQAQRI